MVAGSSAPTGPTVSWRTSERTTSVVSGPTSPAWRARPLRDRGRDGLLDVVRPVEQLARVSAAGPAVQVDPAEADAGDALLLQPGQPGVVALDVVGRLPRACRRVVAGVLEPELDVGRRVDHLPLDDEGVALVRRASRPAARPTAGPPGPPSWRAPGTNPVGEVGGRGAHDVLDHLVAGHARVPVDELCSWLPVAGEITNGGLVLIRSKRSPATGAKNDPSRTSTRSATSLSAALKRARSSARWLTSVATTRSAWPARCRAWTPQPVPRSRRGGDVVPEGELGERGRGGADAEHVVGGHLLRPAVEAGRQVADDPQVGAVGAVGGPVGTAVEPRRHLADRLREHAARPRAPRPAGERPLRVGDGHRALEEEQPDQRRERARRPPYAEAPAWSRCATAPRAPSAPSSSATAS